MTKKLDKRTRVDKAIKLYTSLTDGQMPYHSQAAIGVIVGCSREYVRQRMETLAKKKNKIIPTSEVKRLGYTKNCVVCHNEFESKVPSAKYCGKECYLRYRKEHFFTDVKCEVCEKTKLVLKSRLRRSGMRFCSKRCQGIWLVKTYPNNGAVLSLFKKYKKSNPNGIVYDSQSSQTSQN